MPDSQRLLPGDPQYKRHGTKQGGGRRPRQSTLTVTHVPGSMCYRCARSFIPCLASGISSGAVFPEVDGCGHLSPPEQGLFERHCV